MTVHPEIFSMEEGGACQDHAVSVSDFGEVADVMACGLVVPG